MLKRVQRRQTTTSFLSDDRSESFRGLYTRYSGLTDYVDRLEPAVITAMYKDQKDASTFYPNVGLFFNEFAFVYATGLHK